MRILIINSLYRPLFFGGAEKSVTLLAEALARTGDQVSVITLHPGSEETIEELNGVRVYRVPLDNIYWPYGQERKHNSLQRLEWHLKDVWNRKAAKRVGNILDIEKPDVMHTNVIAGFSISVWREARKRNIPIIHTLRDYYMLCPRSTLFHNGSICQRRCLECRCLTFNRRQASTLVDLVVSNSSYVLETHRRHGYFKGVPSKVIYNIADSFMETHKATPAADSGSLTFGFIGSILPEKGLDVVLEATTKLVNTHWHLRIAGGGLTRYIEQLKHRFGDPRIEWLGFTNSKEFYSSIDVAVISSVWAEPLPRTLIESFAAGKSAICARSGGIPEIASLGRTVETYQAKDVEALANIMNRALANVDVWRSGGFKNPSANAAFSAAAVINRYRAAYRGEVA